MDPRAKALANIAVNHSVQVKPNELILIETDNPEHDICKALIDAIYDCGGMPHLIISNDALLRRIVSRAKDEQFELMRACDDILLDRADGYIIVKGHENNLEFSGVPADRLASYMRLYKRKIAARRHRTKWLVLRLPTPSEAQAAGMHTDEYEDFFYGACCIDYKVLYEKMLPLKQLLEKTKEVHITGPGTDLTFSVEGLPVLIAAGAVNLPDGEVYTAPVRESINGTVQFNTVSVTQGHVFTNVALTFRNGRVVEATCDKTDELNQFLDADENNRYVGEFAFGTNIGITKPVGSILFDEKLGGSFHLALGNCYEECDNGNHAPIHWDLVCIQRPPLGGGHIYLDGVLIRKDGLFVLDSLRALNEI